LTIRTYTFDIVLSHQTAIQTLDTKLKGLLASGYKETVPLLQPEVAEPKIVVFDKEGVAPPKPQWARVFLIKKGMTQLIKLAKKHELLTLKEIELLESYRLLEGYAFYPARFSIQATQLYSPSAETLAMRCRKNTSTTMQLLLTRLLWEGKQYA
jgi:hypothetical protein